MSWQQVSAMGAGNMGGGGNLGGQDLGGMPANGTNQPHATEYTLQGVMRFLQTEWHRHERDRNAWEIERQEMKGRIAALEGSTRRADASQKALKKYVGILEKKVKDQAARLKTAESGNGTADEHAVKQPPKVDRATLIAEKLKSSNDKPKEPIPGLEGLVGERVQEEDEREQLRIFLDQCQSEFTYLMITPANPLPPRDSPPLPMLEDMREGEYGVPAGMQPLDAAFRQLHLNQNHAKDPGPRSQPNHPAPMPQSQIPSLARQNVQELQSAPMVRANDNPPAAYNNQPEWPAPVGVAVTSREDAAMKLNHNEYPRQTTAEDPEKRVVGDSDAWDFGEGTFPETTSSQALQNMPANRPDIDVFPAADNIPKSPNRAPSSHRRKTSLSRRRSLDQELSLNSSSHKAESGNFKLRYGLRGHLNTVRTVIFSGGGSPGEPEICTAGDDGLIKRFHIPRENPSHLGTNTSDLDVPADFTHRGHSGAVLCLTSWSPAPNFSTGGRAQGDGWIFSGGQDASIRVWERGRVDPKATLDGHTDAVWAVCVLPATLGAVFGQTSAYGSPDRILLASGSADGAVKVWAVSAPPQLTSPQPASGRRATGSRGRGNSMSSGSQFPNSPQPSMTSNTPFHHTLVHSVTRARWVES